ncbi:MAG: hypothetical protein AAF962_26925, partial [Actinomycetota bacterium]
LLVLSSCSSMPAASEPANPPIVLEAQRLMMLAERAENTFIRDCMSEAGFVFHGSGEPDGVAPLPTHPQVSFDVGLAQATGYGLFVRSTAVSSAELSRQRGLAYHEGLSDEDRQRFDRAFAGGAGDDLGVMVAGGVSIGMGGCIGQARRELFGEDVLEVYGAFYELQFLPLQTGGSSDALTAALEKWESCMTAAGYGYRTPEEAVAAGLELRGAGESATDGEVALAVADAECRQEVGLRAAADESFRAANEAVFAEHAELFDRWAELERQAQDRVEAVIGEPLF